jgi:Arc/MetJ-type ribon-helix-helix transcriptional regulator
MADVVIAVRVPRTLVAELKERTEQDHFADLSEQLRSIIRRGCLKYTNPVTHEIKELKEQLKEELRKETGELKTEELLAALKDLLAKRGGEER